MVYRGNRPPRDSYACPPKAGHAGTTSRISHVLPKFLMFLDALSNTFLGSCKSKDSDKAEPIPFIFLIVT